MKKVPSSGFKGFFGLLLVGIIVAGIAFWDQAKDIILPDQETSTSVQDGGDLKSVVTDLQKYLLAGEFEKQPVIGDLAQQIVAKIPEYLQDVDRLERDAPGMEIDFIFQAHGYSQDESGRQNVLKSQTKVLRILTQERYDIIAYEGAGMSKVTLDTLVAEMEAGTAFMKSIDPQFCNLRPHDEIVKFMQDRLEFDGVLNFGEKNPTANIIGSEDMLLHRYHSALIGYSEGIYHTDAVWAKKDGELHPVVSEMRSIQSLSKMVAEMKKSGNKRGVIVIGAAHRYGLLLNSKILRLKSRSYSTQ